MTIRTVTAATILLLGACAGQPPRSALERATDATLAARVERALSEDPRLFARHVDVDAEAGVVYLSGYVWTTDDLYAAPKIAANVPGVSRVDSQLELKIGGRNGR